MNLRLAKLREIRDHNISDEDVAAFPGHRVPDRVRMDGHGCLVLLVIDICSLVTHNIVEKTSYKGLNQEYKA